MIRNHHKTSQIIGSVLFTLTAWQIPILLFIDSIDPDLPFLPDSRVVHWMLTVFYLLSLLAIPASLIYCSMIAITFRSRDWLEKGLTLVLFSTFIWWCWLILSMIGIAEPQLGPVIELSVP